MKPSEKTPVGLKLSKQLDPLQYVITVVVEDSRAAQAGLRVDDWLIHIEDNDVRLMDFQQVSQDIQLILTRTGSIHMLVARKKSTVDSGSHPRETLERRKKGEVRHVVLKEALGLDFNSYLPDNENQDQVHFISNVQPSSIAERAGLHDGDRILTINEVDIRTHTHEDVRRMMLSRKPIQLTVINDPKYLELIDSVKSHESKISGSTSNQESIGKPPSGAKDELKNYLHVLFVDDQGSVYFKHCVLKKEPVYDSFGFLLRYTDDFHVIDAVERDFPAHKCGLREGDVLLFVDKKNVEQMTHVDTKTLIRTLATVDKEIHLILIQKSDLQRYKNYQDKNSIDWTSILSRDDEIVPYAASG